MIQNVMSDLTKRLITSSIAIFLVGSFIFLSQKNYFKPIFTLAVITIAIGAIYEFIKLVERKKVFLNKPLIFLSVFFQITSFFVSTQVGGFQILPLIVLFAIILTIFLLRLNKIEDAIEYIAHSVLALLYVALPLGLIIAIAYFNGGDGRFWLTYLLAVTKISDVGAYFGGKLLGRHKLAKKVSPNKTIEGAICGLICSILLSYFWGFYFIHYQNLYDHFSPSIFLALGAIIAILSQAGDLFESLFKRDADIKDSNVLPGLGGILDMVDSLLFTLPFLFLFLEAIS